MVTDQVPPARQSKIGPKGSDTGQPLRRPRALTETQIAVARRLLAQGVTRKIIAQTLKVSSMTLYRALKPYSAGPFPQMGPKSKITAEQRKQIVEAVSSGRKTMAEMARLFKIHPTTVSWIVSQAKART